MKQPALESLLSALDKAQSVLAGTESLRPKLESEITSALDSGDLDEALAASLSIKRSQLELLPAKVQQVERRIQELESQIITEFQRRYVEFQREVTTLRSIVHGQIKGVLAGLDVDDLASERLASEAYEASGTNRQLVSLENQIRHRTGMGDTVAAARLLPGIERELKNLEAAQIKQAAGKS